MFKKSLLLMALFGGVAWAQPAPQPPAAPFTSPPMHLAEFWNPSANGGIGGYSWWPTANGIPEVSVSGGGGGGAVTQGAQAASATGNTWFVQQTGALPAGTNVIGAVSQAGNWIISNISASALPLGAATAALQTTGNTSLSTIAANTSRDAATTDASGTVTTANTFQVVFAANTARKGCLIVNSSANPELIGINTTPAPSATNSIPLAAGSKFTCGSYSVVMDDQISITSGTAASTFVAKQQ
jgi:hypothetical protein